MKEPLEFLSTNLHSIKIDSTSFTVKAGTKVANRKCEYSFDLSGHPLSQRIGEFLAMRGPLWPSGTLIAYCHGFSQLLRHLRESSYETLNGESFAAFIDWLKTAQSPRTLTPFQEGTRNCYSNFVLKFMEWLVDVGEIRVNELFAARLRRQKAFRGYSLRQLQRMRLTAVSPEDFARLVTAVRLEFEECKDLLTRSGTQQNEYEGTFPLLPFTILLGIELGLRPAEFNYLHVRDLRGDRLLLNPPNKNASEVWLSPGLMAAFDLAQKWMLRYREKSLPEDPLLVSQLQKGSRSISPVRFDTMILTQSLKRFYRKYFNLIGPDGMPYLYTTAEDDDSSLMPFSLPFRKSRSAAITEAARHETNPTAVMRFARHKSFTTTVKYYIRETHRQWMTNIALSLAPSAELLRISLDHKVASLGEEKMAQGAGATVPGGHCDQAVAGDRSCRRASDCRLCAFFRIHVSKRDFFVREREDALALARRLQTEEGLTRDAQNLREFAALNQAIIGRIDEHLSGNQ